MRSKAPLILMEQMVMLLVFALAAALCLQAFVKSDAVSRRSEARDRAVILAQSAAETARSRKGDMGARLTETAALLGYSYEQGVLWQDFDEDWNPVQSGGAYRLMAQGVSTETPGLERLHVSVVSGGDAEKALEVLFEIETAWQMEG